MKQPKFKKGEWCFCEFNLSMIKETEGDKITSITDGAFQLGGSDLSDRCFPLDLRIKQISDTVKYWSNRFHEIKAPGLNHPDLNRELVSRWVEMCMVSYNEDQLTPMFKSLEEFARNVIAKARDVRNEYVSGVRIFQ